MSEENAPAAEAPEATEVEETEAPEAETAAEASESSEETTIGQPPPKPEKAKEEATSIPSKRKWKVRGEEKELSDDEAQELINRGDYFDRARKEMEDARFVLNQIKSKPIQSMIELFEGALGSKEKAQAEVRRIIEEYLGAELQYEHASEEEKQRIALTRENERLKAEQETIRARDQKVAQEAEWNTFINDILAIGEKEGLPFDEDFIEELDKVWNEANDLEEKIDRAEVVRRTKKRIERKYERASQKAIQNPAKLLQAAPGLKEQLRKEDIAQVKAANGSKRQPGPSQSAPRDTRTLPRTMSRAAMEEELSRY